MKTYKEIISEVAEPKGEDEKRFKAKHIIQKINHPAAEEGQFTGGKTAKKDKSKLSGHKDGEDEEVYEAHKTDMQERYGDKWKSVMYASSVKKSMEESVVVEDEMISEAFKAGAMKLADGTAAKLTNEEASALNTLFKELTSANQKKMQERMMKDKKGFSEIVSFAKEAL